VNLHEVEVPIYNIGGQTLMSKKKREIQIWILPCVSKEVAHKVD